MKKSIKPILLAISILIISASVAGCADNEKTTDTSVANTESTISSGSLSSAEESVMSSTTTTTNPYDTSKPIDTTTPPASSSTASSTTSEPENSDTNSSSNSEPTNSSSNSSNTSSSSNGTNSSSNSTPSSSSGTGAISPITGKPITITIPAGTPGEYFDQYGNPMPDGFDPSNGGYYERDGSYVMTPEEKAAMDRELEDAGNNLSDGTSGMTQEDFDYLNSLLGI